MVKIRKKIILLTAILLTVFLGVGAVLAFPHLNFDSAGAETTVTTAAQGKVSLKELCLRHDVVEAVLPDGYSDSGLNELVAEGKLVVSSTKYKMEGGKLLGYDATTAALGQKVLLVLPANVTEINASDSDIGGVRVFRKLKSNVTGIAFAGNSIASIPAKCFQEFSNLRFAVLPDSVKTIGAEAFSNCNQLRDIVMPGVTSIESKAFETNTALLHVSLPDGIADSGVAAEAFLNAANLRDVEKPIAVSESKFPAAMNFYTSASRKSYLYVMESFSMGAPTTASSSQNDRDTSSKRNINHSLAFYYNMRLTDTLATAGGAAAYQPNKWYFTGLDGAEDKQLDFEWAETTEYHFPATLDLTAARENITYDFLGADGTKYVNTFTGDTTVTEYDIAKAACYNVSFTRIFLPEGDTVKIVGDWAFYGSQTTVANIPSSVNTIGQSAFRQSHRNWGGSNGKNSTVYIGKQKGTELKIGNYAFALGLAWGFCPTTAPSAPITNATRRFVFADSEAYLDELGVQDASASVPNVSAAKTVLDKKYNTGGDATITYTFKTPVYTAVVNGEAQDKKLIGYRLYNNEFRFTMDDDQSWTAKPADTLALPVLDGFKKNVWYQSAEALSAPTESNRVDENFTYINEQLKTAPRYGKVSEIVLYTKLIGAPAVTQPITREFSEEISQSPDAALSLNTGENAANYNVTLESFTPVVGSAAERAFVHDAGTYSLRVILDPRWGEWDTAVHDHVYTVTVTRAEIDLGDPDNLPEFVIEGGAPLGGSGDGTSLYRYTDGWYLYAKSTGEPESTQSVLNAYARYTGNPITITADTTGLRYGVRADSSSEVTETRSRQNLAGFTFDMKDPNYVFSYREHEGAAAIFSKLGVSYGNLSLGQSGLTSVSVSKYWYIVMQQNWLIDSNAVGGSEEQFNLLTKDGVPVSTFEYETTFGTGAGQIEVHIPKIARGPEDTAINFTLTCEDGTAITKGETPVSELSKYINAAMPAGTYTVRIMAGEVNDGTTVLPAINDIVRITVTSGTLDTAEIEELLTGKDFEHLYERNAVHMYDADTQEQLRALIQELNAKINTVRKALNGASNVSVWGGAEYDRFYNELAVTYNLDRLQTSEYFTVAQLRESYADKAPIEVGQYVVYYALSALNYLSVGGESAGSARRNYTFDTTIFRELSTNGLLASTVEELSYTGNTLQPAVNYNPYYRHEFPDAEYVNKGTHTVTFTITDPILTRWSQENVPDNVKIEGNVATLTFEILAATNTWTVTPQIPSWSFYGFDASIHRISSTLRFGDSAVMFRIEKEGVGFVGKDGKIIPYGNVTADNVLEFTVDEEGRVGDAVAAILNALKPDTYRLYSTVSNYENGNVVGFTTAESARNLIIISKAANRWTTSPNVVRWNWREYNKTKNLISGTPLYLNVADLTGLKVKFTVLDANKKALAGLIGFTLDDDGLVDDTVAAILENLSANVNGTYYLLATVEDTEYYAGLNTYVLPDGVTEVEAGFDFTSFNLNLAPFDVAKANNYWETSPGMTGWQYNAYTAESNFIAGDPKFLAEGKKVVYYVYKSKVQPTYGQALTDEDVTFTDIAAAQQYLLSRKVDSYWFVAHVDGTDDFTELTAYISFNVVQNVTNAWITPPSITGWVYGAFNASSVSAGEATFGTENAKYTVSVSESGVAGFIDLGFEDLTKKLKDLDAGTYRLTVVCADNVEDAALANFNAATRMLDFVVAQAENEWQISPSITGWTWNDTAHDPVEGVTKYPNGGISGVYYKADSDGSLGEQVDGVPTLAGLYAYVTTAAASKNYKEITHTAHFTVAQLQNTWTTEPETTLSWTWGDEVASTIKLVGAAALKGTPKYTIRSDAWENAKEYAQADIQQALQQLGAGTYSVVVTVEGSETTFSGLSATTSLTVSKATLSWKDGTAPADATWAWDAADSAKTFVTPLVQGAVEGEEVSVSYKVVYTNVAGDATETKEFTQKTLADLEAFLKDKSVGAHAGTYVITIAATDPNYFDFSGSATVTVKKAQNDWIAGSAPYDTVSANYKNFKESNFPADPAPKFGKDSRKYELRTESGNTTITKALHEYFNEQRTSKVAGVYQLYTVIEATNDYEGIEKLTQVTVLSQASHWTNESELSSEGKITYGGKSYGDTFTIVVPYMASIGTGESVVYETKYAGAAKDVTLPDTHEELAEYFKTRRNAGTYTITARYTNADEDISNLVYEITVGIGKAEISWGDTRPEAVAGYPYNNVTMKVPAVADRTVQYQVNVNGVVTIPPIGEGEKYDTIVDYLNTLPVGTYTLTCSVAEDENYTGLSTETTLIITKASNAWATVEGKDTTPPASYSLTRGDACALSVPVAQRGTVVFTVSGGGLTTDAHPAAADLKSYLAGLPAGIYTLVSEVADDGNYAGLRAETRFEMKKQENGWKTRLDATYNLTWSKDGVSVPTPEALKNNGALRFDIQSLTEGVSYTQTGYTAAQYEAWLKTVQAAVYRITYYVPDTDGDIEGVTGETVVTINKKANAWTEEPSETVLNWTYGDEQTPLEFKAEYGTDQIKYYVNGVVLNGNLMNALNALSVGEYTVRAEIEESENYRSLSKDITLKITQGMNGWASELAISGWQWDEDLTVVKGWAAPKPLRGGVVNVTVTKVGTGEEVFAFALRYYYEDDGTETDNAELLIARLCALNAGSYKIKAEIPASINWGGTFVTEKTFEVSANENAWIGGNPTVQDWTYGSSRNLPAVGGVKYGSVQDIRYTYYYNGAVVNDFTKAGTYTFTAVVAASAEGNYPELKYEGSFKIEKAQGGWQTAVGITPWTWNEFDANKNLFVGAAVSGGKVTFTVKDAQGQIVVEGLAPDSNGVIADAAKLAVLKNKDVMLAGNYTYEVTAAETENHLAERASGSFTIAQATNRWLTYPRVKMWAENLWSSDKNMPEVAARYGEITLTITDDNADVSKRIVYFEAVYNADGTMKGTARINKLIEAAGGKYLIHGYVAADAARYEGLDDTAQIEVFLSSEERPVNYWVKYPKISDWTAGEGAGPVLDQAVAYRSSKIVKTYYYVVNGQKGEQVRESEINEKGYPTLPGKYILNVVSTFENYEFDRLEEDVEFEIYKRIIEWTVTPNIVDWELSGEASKPVATINFGDEADSKVTFAYRLSTQTDAEAVATLPTEPGSYVMIVTASAKYCDSITAYVDFKVSLSKNTWIDIPVIENWSEEFDPSEPLGKAQFGTVTYTYKNAKGEILTEKPTQEGTYIMYATVELAGYETLTAEYEFTITPAFDTTLLIVDIVLAGMVCVFTGICIYFAIRRYKENG